jgi:hypothetical protein
MAQSAGLVNRAMNRIGPLGADGPGLFYYGINAADRGLGYRGSYMTLGGFIPAVQDDLGGFWSADLRTHLSQYGGFFSNVGAVRKQFIGGTILGVGVYWDYDGDMNQYPATSIPTGNGSVFSLAGGQTYNQVGVSGEWLTDWGNLRTNGYIPVGTTAQQFGPFLGDRVLCVNGLNAALGGVDLEVGAYIPGLSDWAGMISVGGYGYGNTRYTWERGTQAGQAVVPWFGGVFTRLDMTFIENWDFSLQANNDSYFDWTGFARITYRMGASRRRNVADQMEQPMMRNEHIVRAYQQPQLAINPQTGDPWRVIFVDNSADTGGNGTWESPYTTLSQAEAAALLPYDIVFVAAGNSATTPYETPLSGYSFNAPNQYLVGDGSRFLLPTLTCGPSAVFASKNPQVYPLIANQSATLLGMAEAAVVIEQPGTVVSHIQIVNSPIGISDGPELGLLAPGTAIVSDVIISGGEPGNNRRGIQIANSTGRFILDQLQMQNLGNDALVVSAGNGNVSVSNSVFTEANGWAILASGAGARVAVDTTTVRGTAGAAIEAAGTDSRIVVTRSTIDGSTPSDPGTPITEQGMVASGVRSQVTAADSTITLVRGAAVVASGTGAYVDGSSLQLQQIQGNGLVASGSAANIVLASSNMQEIAGFGALVSGDEAGLYLVDGTLIEDVGADAIHAIGRDNTVLLQDSRITRAESNGVFASGAAGSTRTQVTLLRSEVELGGSGLNAVVARNVGVTTNPNDEGVVQIFASKIGRAPSRTGNLGNGVFAENSSVDIGRDPGNPTGSSSFITGTGIGILSEGFSAVRVVDSEITRVSVGISASGAFVGAGGAFGNLPGPPAALTNNLIAIGNNIRAEDTGIFIQAAHGAAEPEIGALPQFVSAQLLQNRITTSGPDGEDIDLVVLAPPAPAAIIRHPITLLDTTTESQLSGFNFGADVNLTPAALPLRSLFFGTPARVPIAPPNRPVPLPPPPSP